jgi:hypothetical protein
MVAGVCGYVCPQQEQHAMHNDYDHEAGTLVLPSPFADPAMTKEAVVENLYESYGDSEAVDPFAATMNAGPVVVSDPRKAAHGEFLADLEDDEFNEVLYNVAGEILERGDPGSTSQFEFGGTQVSLAQQAYVNQLSEATERFIERVRGHLEAQPMASLTEDEVDQLLEQFKLPNEGFTPVQDQFFDKIVKTVGNVVKGGVNLVKKGIKAVGKVLPIGPILDKIKKLVKPLLERVLKFAIGKLPKNLQPHARTLAKKMLGIDAEASFAMETETEAGVEAIQNEFNNTVATIANAETEGEANSSVDEYNAIPAGEDAPDLNAARQRFVNELKQLKPGQDPTPVIENFLPAALVALYPAIKIALSIIGRDKVISFLAKPLGSLVKKYVPEAISVPLASKIIDVGMGLIGFETQEGEASTPAFEAVANTIEESIVGMNAGQLMEEATEENLAVARRSMMEAFEAAAANNFPNSYIKEEFRTTTSEGVWVLMPRNAKGNYAYKKYSRVFEVNLDAAKVRQVRSFRHLPLANFLRDKFNIDLKSPVKARVHVYEAIKGTWLSKISMHEKVPGLGSASQNAWNQLHPLTPMAAAALLGEGGLGRQFSPVFTASRHRIGVGQRFYFLELGRTPVSRPTPTKPGPQPPPGQKIPARSGDVQAVLNFKQGLIRLNCYFSEADAVSIASKLRNNDYLGAAKSIETSMRNTLHGILVNHIGDKVKLIHETGPQPQTEEFLGAAVGAIGRAVSGAAGGVAVGLLKSLLEKLANILLDKAVKAVENYLKARAAEFIAAQADAKDGVTVKVTFNNVPGMAAISTLIQAVKGKLTLGNIADIALPTLPTPEVAVKADKQFD